MDLASMRSRRERAHADHDRAATHDRDTEEHAVQDRHGNQGVQALARAGAQAKLEVGAADDAHEREADRVADEVMGGNVAQPTRSADAPAIQRAGGGEGFAASEDVESRLAGAAGGQRLPADVQATMEAKTGAAFGDVRVHDDDRAHGLASQMAAHAFTIGNDIHFARGAYDPGSRAGQHLLAHELTHVVQQAGGQREGVQRQAISAAPASVQRKGFFSKLFGGGTKKEEKEERAVPSLEAITGNATHARHYAEWGLAHNQEGSSDGNGMKGDTGVALEVLRNLYDGAWKQAVAEATRAIEIVEYSAGDSDDESAIDWSATDTVRATGALHRELSEEEDLLRTVKEIEARSHATINQRLPRDLLDPLKPLWAKTRTHNPAFMTAVIAYQAAWDRAIDVARRIYRYVSTDDDVNLSDKEKQKYLSSFDESVLMATTHYAPSALYGGGIGMNQRASAYEQYAQDESVQEYYRSQRG